MFKIYCENLRLIKEVEYFIFIDIIRFYVVVVIKVVYGVCVDFYVEYRIVLFLEVRYVVFIKRFLRYIGIFKIRK